MDVATAPLDSGCFCSRSADDPAAMMRRCLTLNGDAWKPGRKRAKPTKTPPPLDHAQIERCSPARYAPDIASLIYTIRGDSRAAVPRWS
jgi:hypothetical protein